MPVVNVTICSSTFPIACGAGQEQHVQELAKALDKRAETALKGAGRNGDIRGVLVMLALTLENELQDMQKRLDAVPQAAVSTSENDEGTALAVTQLIDTISERIEKVANTLETV